MRTRIIIFLLSLFSFNGYCQKDRKLTFENLKVSIIDDLDRLKAIDSTWVKKLKSGEYSLDISGLENNSRNGELKEGVYSFVIHGYAYWIFVENNSYRLLDFRTRHGMDLAILSLLDFCDRNRYCVEVTSKYVAKLLAIYYHSNKDISRGLDINCQRGIIDTKVLP